MPQQFAGHNSLQTNRSPTAHQPFSRAKRHFKLKGITNSITNADYALEAVAEAVFQNNLTMAGSRTGRNSMRHLKLPYSGSFNCQHLSVHLHCWINQGSPTSPTHVWHKIATLRQLPEIDDTTKHYKHLDLYKEIWLQCLSPEVRSALHDSEGSMDELIKRADQLTIALNAANYQSSK